MTSLTAFARLTGQSDLVDRANRMSLWKADIQMSSGAVQGGKVTTPEKQSPAAFNTRMVLDGFLSVLQERDDGAIFRAAERAGEFLVNDLNDKGMFRTNGAFVSTKSIKTFNVLCAWAMHRLGELTENTLYSDAAIRAVEGALKLRQENGWFAENCLNDHLRPLTHNIGYGQGHFGNRSCSRPRRLRGGQRTLPAGYFAKYRGERISGRPLRFRLASHSLLGLPNRIRTDCDCRVSTGGVAGDRSRLPHRSP